MGEAGISAIEASRNSTIHRSSEPTQYWVQAVLADPALRALRATPQFVKWRSDAGAPDPPNR